MKSHPTYEILQEIGRGEATVVYRARDLSLKRYVAIKELQDKYQRGPRQMEQFWEDAQFVANLGHDNIVQVYGVDKERGWIILELMRGGLDAKLAGGALPPDLVRSVLRQALEALQFLHKRNRLHGAVKPSNLLINDEGRVKLSDSMGVSIGGEMRKPTGTPKYLAPESLSGQFGPTGPGVDLYALGFTALELLKGPKFDGLFKGVGTDAADPGLGWLRWHSSSAERLPPIREVVPGAPPDLAGVIERMIKKQVSERYSSAAEALRDLDERPIQLVDPLPAAIVGAGKAGKEPDGGRVEVVQAGDISRNAEAGPEDDQQRRSSVVKSNRPLKPWSKPWIKKKLEDRRIYVAVLAAIIIPAAILFFAIPSGVQKKKKMPADEVAQVSPKPIPKPKPKPMPETKPKPEPKPEPKPKPEPVKPDVPVVLEKTRTNALGMSFVLVNSGQFSMGSPEGTGDPNEQPKHEVSITKPFYIGETEVTQAQYKSVMGENPSYFAPGRAGEDLVSGDSGELPVESVSYDDAVNFCKKLAEKEALPAGSYRLPTEAEWEYAARGVPKGSDDPADDLAQRGWFEDNAGRHTNPVRKKKPNALGLYDTAGNVWEWCSDWFDEGYYRRSPGENPAGPDGVMETRVIRGGGWIANAHLCRPTDRNASDPSERINCYGFRVVLDPAVAFRKPADPAK